MEAIFVFKDNRQNRSQEEIDYLLQYPKIFKFVRADKTFFTREFRNCVWNLSDGKPSPAFVRQALIEVSEDKNLPVVAGYQVIKDLAHHLKRDGKPRGAANSVFGISDQLSSDPEYDKFLLENGWLKPGRNRGYSFTDKFRLILACRAEGQSIEDAIMAAGLDLSRIGYQRLAVLKRQEQEAGTARVFSPNSPADIEYLLTSAFISSVTEKQIRYSKEFDLWALKLRSSFTPVEILELFGIDCSKLSSSARLRLVNRIKYRNPAAQAENSLPPIPGSADEVSLFLKRYILLLHNRTSKGFSQISSVWKKLDCHEKRSVCSIIQAGTGPDGFTLDSLLKACSIPRSSWYGITSNPDYGQSLSKRKEQEKADLKDIKDILEYKGFKKGSRQIKLQLEQKKNRKIGLHKIQRLMKENGLSSGIRVKDSGRIAQKKAVKENTKPNLLQRRFRLNRPGEVKLSDVSYLDYDGGTKRAYLSAVKDASSGKIEPPLVSDSQDLALGIETIGSLPAPLPSGSLFHSDQGYLYLNPCFQKKLAQSGYEQSMSRRGNCWDNSPMESFFGHFKDETDYRSCKTLEELQSLLAEYAYYYNYERCQPCRNNMTPAEFENYLNGMDKAQWDQYQAIELEKYNRMLEQAEKSAVDRARIDKAIVQESQYGQKKRQEKEEWQEGSLQTVKSGTEAALYFRSCRQ